MNWKERLYDNYISSGQSQITSSEFEQQFKSTRLFSNYLIKQFFPKDKYIPIIDLGCGSGAFIYHCLKANYQNIKGVDISAQQVEYAHRAGLMMIEQGNIMQYLKKLKNGSVSIFVLNDILEHLDRQEIFDCLDLVYSKLKKGGKVLIHVPNGEGLFGNRIRYGDLTHEMAFTPSSMRQLGKTIGFSQINTFEDKLIIKSISGLMRRIIWGIGTFFFRILHLAETGVYQVILTQNFLTEFIKK